MPAPDTLIRKTVRYLPRLFLAVTGAFPGLSATAGGDMPVMTVHRLTDEPVITADLDPSIGTNIQGPSLIRVPDWVSGRLGRYYLYFADHKGTWIRLAWADELTGPWTIHRKGTLHLEESGFLTSPAAIPRKYQARTGLGGWATGPTEGVPAPLDSATKPHIASPDVHVRDDRQEIIMYFHGLEGFANQKTRVAVSRDGIHFRVLEPLVANSYLRMYRSGDSWYGLAMPGIFYRSPDGLSGFTSSPVRLFPDTMRHSALLLRGEDLFVFWTRVGDVPEHILVTRVNTSGDWSQWKNEGTIDLLYPEKSWEGATLPLVPSVRDAINVPVNQLRDPAIYQEGEKTFLLYAVAGESGIAIAELEIAP